jgi:hypothetical protein
LENHFRPAYPSIKVRHLVDEYRQDRCDSVWLPNLAAEGGWTVISKDGGQHSKSSGKPSLPELCIEYGVTCVAFTGGLGNARAVDHQEALNEVMANIEPIYQAPKGTIIKIGRDFVKGGIKRYALRVKQRSLGVFLGTLVSN